MTLDATSAPLEIDVTRHGAVTILSVRGEIDLTTAPHLTESIGSAIGEASSSAIVVDLTSVEFLASVGMTVLIEASRLVGTSTTFAVIASGPSTARPLTVMGLDQTFAIYPDLDTAVAALAP